MNKSGYSLNNHPFIRLLGDYHRSGWEPLFLNHCVTHTGLEVSFGWPGTPDHRLILQRNGIIYRAENDVEVEGSASQSLQKLPPEDYKPFKEMVIGLVGLLGEGGNLEFIPDLRERSAPTIFKGFKLYYPNSQELVESYRCGPFGYTAPDGQQFRFDQGSNPVENVTGNLVVEFPAQKLTDLPKDQVGNVVLFMESLETK